MSGDRIKRCKSIIPEENEFLKTEWREGREKKDNLLLWCFPVIFRFQ